MAKDISAKNCNVVYVRIDDKRIKWLYKLMVGTGQPMRGVVECMIDYCMNAQDFRVPERELKVLGVMQGMASRRKEKYKEKISKL